MSRNTITWYVPTKRWLRYQNPVTREEVKKWYARELKALEARCSRSTSRKMECWEVTIDRETRAPIKRSEEPKIYEIEKWRVSTAKNKCGLSDFEIYKAHLDLRLKKLLEEATCQTTPG